MSERRTLSTPVKLAVDFGPLLVFFLANKFAGGSHPIYVATGAFMAATLAAMGVSLAITRRIPPMLILTGVIVGVFGGLTLWLQDDLFIKLKPTLIYLTFAAILLFGMVTGRPYLRLVLHDAFPALDERGWAKLTRNWALFFLGLALANEVARRVLTTDQWVDFKVWGVTAASFLFALAQTPILMRHGKKPG
jgi:intracellular septation protein